MANQPLLSGKLPHHLLAELLAGLPTADAQIVVGPSVGEDAAIVDFARGHDYLLVAKSDPITFATDQIGYYAVNVCANDLAVTGATPRFYLPTVLLPAGSADTRMVESIFAQIGDACRSLGIVVAGGHSEITLAVNQPVVAGSMLGEVQRGRFVRSGSCAPGDLVLLAGSAPVEGTSIIAREMRSRLLVRGWREAELDEAANYLFEPGISVLKPALAAAHAGLVTAMHDPTEGGIATGLLEMALAADAGMEINLDRIPVSQLSRRLCAAFELDPLGTLASGALLATARPQNVAGLLRTWLDVGWSGVVIGKMTAAETGLAALIDGLPVPFPHFSADEVTRLWA